MTGGTGNDTFYGPSGNDIYYFNYGDGNDLIYDDHDSDVIEFGAGITQSDISFELLDSTVDDFGIVIDGGLGGSITIIDQYDSSNETIETLQFSDAATFNIVTGLSLTRHGTAAYDFIKTNAYIDTHDYTVYGYETGDTLWGDDGFDIIYAGGGDDYLYDCNGDDTLYGEAGDDYIRGDNGEDLLIGGDGNNTLYGGSQNDILRGGLGDDYIDGDGGTDLLDYSQSASAVFVDLETRVATGEGTDTLRDIENVTGLNYDDTFVTDYAANYIHGGAGNDTLDYSLTYGKNYTITINLGTGTVSGYGASDTSINIENLIGRKGNDVMTGSDVANVMK